MGAAGPGDPRAVGPGASGGPAARRVPHGGGAWAAHREGSIDAAVFGMHGTGNFGPAEIRGNAVRDLAALSKLEMLPWDEWGRMTEAYAHRTGPDYDELLD